MHIFTLLVALADFSATLQTVAHVAQVALADFSATLQTVARACQI
jgi:hypothetical protein